MPLKLRDELPSLEGATRWINGPAITTADLAEHPVLVHFWSVSCYVCRDVAPYVVGWHERYTAFGLELISVHQPRTPEEFDIEHAVADSASIMKLRHRVALDNGLSIVERFDNQFVPAYYVFDRHHRLRHFQAGDKSYQLIEAAIERVLGKVPQTARA